MSKARRGDKSFQAGGAGKGDADRTSDRDAYSQGYDEIDWGRKQPPPPAAPSPAAPTEVKHVTDAPEDYENPYVRIAPDGKRYVGEAY